MPPSSTPARTASAPQPTGVEEGTGGDGGDVVILDDLPARFTIGCDHVSVSTTTRAFRGVRDVPPGVHLVWVAPTDSTSSRSGFWFVTDAGTRVHAKRWDAADEVLVSGDAADADEDAQRRRLGDVLPALASYRFPAVSGRQAKEVEADLLPPFIQDKAAVWSYLTSAITPQLLDSVMGDRRRRESGDGQRASAGASWPVTSSDRVLGESRTPEEARLYNSGIGSSGSGGGGDPSDPSPPPLRFMFRMDEQLFDTAAEGAERTRQALDPTEWIIGMLDGAASAQTKEQAQAETHPPSSPQPDTDPGRAGANKRDHNQHHPEAAGADRLLGEQQLAFLTGAHLGNFSCLEQWHFGLSRVALRAHGLAARRPGLARDLLRALHAQLAYADLCLEGDVLEALVSDPGYHQPGRGHAKGGLRRALTTYRARLEEMKGASARADEKNENKDRDGDGGGKEEMVVGLEEVATAFADLEAYLGRRRGWDLRADAYLRSGDLMLEDGEVVRDVELDEFADEDERGEFAPVVVGLDELGRQTDLVSWDR